MKKLLAAAAVALAAGSFTAGTANAGGGDSIYDIASTIPTLKAAIDAAGLDEALDNCEYGPVTVFAPTEEAFGDVDPTIIAALLADPEALADVLLYHATPGEYLSAAVLALESPFELTMANGDKATLVIDTDEPSVMINDANVIIGEGTIDIEACNGVIHLIDAVLIPPADEDLGHDTGSGTTLAMLAAAMLGTGLLVTTISRRRVTA